MARRKGQQHEPDAASGAAPARPVAPRAGLVFGDGDRVLDKGVWKRWKMCQHCQQIVVERAKWKDCWNEIRFCSDRCKAEGKRNRRQQQGQEQQPKQQGKEEQQQQQQQRGSQQQEQQQAYKQGQPEQQKQPELAALAAEAAG